MNPTHDFPIVGIGASAGGLAAFEQLFPKLPPDSGIAFVVVQHLSPPHKSILPEIIQRLTSMPVSQVTHRMEVKPNRVYVIPPGHNLALRDGHLMLLDPAQTREPRLPIDLFFRSLARDQGGRAISIVLSGTGSDGSLGVKTIKAEGGLTIAQDPDTAEFGDMPRNAIATQDVDFILPPQKMGELILKVIHHQVLDEFRRSEGDLPISGEGLQQLFYLVRAKTGHDFALYKNNTLLRRIERRMKITLKNNLEEYIDHIQAHPQEIDALFRDMLINVTEFFRDPEAFQALAEKAIRPLVLLKQAAHLPLRVWVAGCSSGEEAYSIAITIQEQMDALKTDGKMQVFATDLDGEAITTARKGLYSDGSLENVSTERLQRFFHPEAEGYQVSKFIRDRVVFSTQNLISDPPFSKIDLVCCRNVLIYLEHALQNQLISQFHYSLNPEGVLFLGNSESLGRKADLFVEVDRKHKIFRRQITAMHHRIQVRSDRVPPRVVPPAPDSRADRLGRSTLRATTEKALLKFHTPACVLIDEKHDLVFVHGRTGKYLEPVPGETTTNLVRMAREGLKTELATALQQAAARNEEVRREGVRVKTNGDTQVVTLTVRPIQGSPDGPDLVMVVFEDGQEAPGETALPATNAPTRTRRVAQLEKELKAKDEYLHSIIDELESTNQQLLSANEELQSTNEEMQSTNEELETSKEELQSINEELSTINAELQNKNEELIGVNNDMFNLLSSTEIGTIFVDLDLHLRRYTPEVQNLYNFLPTDIGRPVGHFVSSLEYDHLVQDVQQVLATLESKAIEAKAKNGTWYLVNIKPYRTLEHVVDGAVITFTDISQQKRGDELRRLGTILRDSNDAITVQDFQGKILAWNRGASQLYGWSEAEALTMSALDLLPENKRAEVIALYKRLSEGESIRSYETQRLTQDGRILDIWMTISTLVDDADRPVGIATTERDITNRRVGDQRPALEYRVLRALNRWHQILLDRGESELQGNEICQILVEEAGYRLAWMGKGVKATAKPILPVAWGGLEEDGSDPRDATTSLADKSRQLMKSVLRSGQPAAIRNILSDPAQSAWQDDARRYNFGSFLVLPVFHKGDPRGVLVIYAAEPGAFVDPEVRWLSRLSESLSKALEAGWLKLETPAQEVT